MRHPTKIFTFRNNHKERKIPIPFLYKVIEANQKRKLTQKKETWSRRIPFSTSPSLCNGSIAECGEDNELLMESEISRRILEQSKYISPGALKRDQPVCNGGASGQSYSSSCLPPSSNPETRGCSKYYRCRSDSR
ncbi:protein RALF-like 32 [Manihot esculenta]|nr:protein RALF-like 32 [Manihot esculenta]KAG8655010.1 hypothetical protein MANES_05G201886v8 [Manihot esculenta]